ncbi:MAG TPA: hypothetical protein PLD47_10280 [Aggregatilineales bacterium]|nr:hypothetical protein [Anaerolineales bacterium]HRE48101.1 hypothetical protein [Aggregatilineales bacterium]
MKTPAGKECPHYYADFHRQRSKQECRLAKRNPASAAWKPGDCVRCAVPDILRANASPHLNLTLTIRPGIVFGIGRAVVVTAHCEKHQVAVADAFVGCPQCNEERPGFDLFRDVINTLDDPQTP